MRRGWKIIRNLLLSVLLGLAVYAMMGFPVFTVRQMLNQVERQNLLSDLEPLLVERCTRGYANSVTDYHDTYLMARTGGTYLATSYSRKFLTAFPERRWGLKLSQGAVCAAREGTLYIAGNFAEAVSAQVEVAVQKTTQFYDADTETFDTALGERRTYRCQGERISDAVFAFRYRRENGDWNIRESEYGLEEAAHNWYRCYFPSGAVGYIPVRLPVKLTLYDQNNSVLETVDLTISPEELGGSWLAQ